MNPIGGVTCRNHALMGALICGLVTKSEDVDEEICWEGEEDKQKDGKNETVEGVEKELLEDE